MKGTLKVPCLFCGVKAGRHCRTRSGRSSKAHRLRAVALAVAAAELDHSFRLTEGPC